DRRRPACRRPRGGLVLAGRRPGGGLPDRGRGDPPSAPGRRPARLRDRRRRRQCRGAEARRGGREEAACDRRVSCAFDLDHYRELLAAARTGGYRFSFFDRTPEPGDILLRHDVDLSLDAALEVAELEAESGAAATYFLMTRSEFYNLASPSGERVLQRLREL